MADSKSNKHPKTASPPPPKKKTVHMIAAGESLWRAKLCCNPSLDPERKNMCPGMD